MEDFLLGNLDSIQAENLINALSGGREDYAASQLDRVFASQAIITVRESCSHPRTFYQTLFCVGPLNIKKVVIFSRPAPELTVGDLYSVDLHFVNGIIRFQANWSAYKADRAEEIFGSMLLALKSAGLEEVINFKCGYRPNFFEQEYASAASIRHLFELTDKNHLYTEEWCIEQGRVLCSN
ncbi:hypothetical protein AB4455_03545 [Vibrio sp. 10N.261.46.E12]|uniref:hypothetical protein n=1 Tax=unclassified Vibrio TaxID=2614977 RepID=UPI0009784876|nr:MULTISPECIES: hypothetical protein [unclassified Vibrio]OMO38348.1 hypothetical protein BH584_01655 [Vibrio sp. 10N.261.45.E1]PMJ19527.1 hypothetical protein BCU27_21540 [Vibrio sp. 10N.286.45.B6]PML84273.1 hypothetical protein BCT66_17755 [Vibrio sp. 10N.261.49.E11]PMM79803.1 hypothetical protein BCT46_19620 [Vibrio sp. 10N.261.46.E8]PMN47539.1 hypothetical protein BCT32_09530 [Vibrio sp. 10N.261.45.E11]